MIREKKSKSIIFVSLLFGILLALGCFIDWKVLSQEVGKIVYIKEHKASLRESIDGPTIAELSQSTPISVIEKKNDWIKIQLTGWLPANAVILSKEELSNIPKLISITLNLSSTNKAEDREVNGIVINADPNLYKVLVYVKTDDWYKQPFCDSRGNLEIRSDGTWSTWSRAGKVYAYLVAKDYDPPCRLSMPLEVDNKKVFAQFVEK